MATTSFLYHAFGLRGYRHLRTEYIGGEDIHHVELHPKKRRCRGCNAPWWKLTLAGSFRRRFRALPVGSRPQWIELHGHLQACEACGRTLREPIAFARGKRRCIRRLERFMLDLCRRMTIRQVADLLRVGWDVVKDIHKEYLHRRSRKPRLSKVRYLGVDEFATRKGHRYMTVVVDLETGAVLWVHEGKDAAALLPFLWKLHRARAPLQAVAMDMGEAYRKAVRQVFPEVDIVFDPYHVVALASRAVDETRRDLYRKLRGQERKVIKGSRFLLPHAGQRLDPDAQQRLRELAEANEPLYTAYLLKESVRMFWKMGDEETASAVLDNWIAEARASGLPHFERLANTLDTHRAGLLAYFRHSITTAPLEGLNNKIKVLKRQAYGFRDQEYFKLRVLFINGPTPSFAG